MSDEALRRYKEVFASTKHPVVRIHPVTGERHLLLGHFVKHLLTINDYGDAHRVMYRVTLAGDVAVGIDGQTSRACHQLARDGEASKPAARSKRRLDQD
ncbi:hypothetical protein [Crenobacter cavernae]|uniref:hypothetical protein n=1 Tax=Crenobacter cavernae TaxID=2290923 RepID=UPI001C69B512|nr:hypothetical protein [Crenobacter cavernae]